MTSKAKAAGLGLGSWMNMQSLMEERKAELLTSKAARKAKSLDQPKKVQIIYFRRTAPVSD